MQACEGLCGLCVGLGGGKVTDDALPLAACCSSPLLMNQTTGLESWHTSPDLQGRWGGGVTHPAKIENGANLCGIYTIQLQLSNLT